MRTPRAEPRHAVLLGLLVVSATAVLLATGGKSAGQPPAPATSPSAWQGLVGSRPRVAPSRRVIVVLKTPSLAQRVAAAGGVAGTEHERAWTYLGGRVLPGIDVVGGAWSALAATRPDNSSRVERHGTEMAGLLVGAGGPSGLAGVATGAAVLPVRVAGWQPDALGHWAIYARSDQLIAGLDRAVDPNDDGDAHDAARVALVSLAAPFAGFADGPEALAAEGALALDTLVVAPVGNDGSAAAGYGDVS